MGLKLSTEVPVCWSQLYPPTSNVDHDEPMTTPQVIIHISNKVSYNQDIASVITTIGWFNGGCQPVINHLTVDFMSLGWYVVVKTVRQFHPGRVHQSDFNENKC